MRVSVEIHGGPADRSVPPAPHSSMRGKATADFGRETPAFKPPHAPASSRTAASTRPSQPRASHIFWAAAGTKGAERRTQIRAVSRMLKMTVPSRSLRAGSFARAHGAEASTYLLPPLTSSHAAARAL